MTESINIVSTRLLVQLIKKLDIDLSDIPPETVAWFENAVSDELVKRQQEVVEKAEQLSKRIKDLEHRDDLVTEFEPLARDITYSTGVRDGMYITKKALIEALKSDKKTHEKIHELLPDHEPSHILRDKLVHNRVEEDGE